RATAEPSGTAVRCNVSNAMPKPARPGIAFANTRGSGTADPAMQDDHDTRVNDGKHCEYTAACGTDTETQRQYCADKQSHHAGPDHEIVPGPFRRWHANMAVTLDDEEAKYEDNEIEKECRPCRPVNRSEY